tara:strand:+ start:863 stop:1489 length:627 start_codon:yes stop_codon:yes gene_type:complete
MYKIKLEQISPWGVNTVKDSFNKLPKTNHRDGEYRLRRYSKIKLSDTDDFKYMKMESEAFNQSAHYNQFQGGVDRKFEDIEDEVVHSGGMMEMCDTFLQSSGFSDDHEIEIHQMRIVTKNELTPVSPEGVHQDGYRFIAMVGINRYNITGGNLLVCKTYEGKPIVDFPLEDGEMIMLDDKAMWHNATQIKPISDAVQGWMDAFILTAK